MSLNIIWYCLIFSLFAGYAVLDGFDLGVGALHLFAGRTDNERRLVLNSIGPVWDGNEVWLVVAGGALFAAFPYVYATVFSGFYLALMVLLLALVFRAVAIEFRSKRPQRWWRQTWDVAFSAASFLVAFLLGTALGNIISGIPLDADGNYAGSFFQLLNPYAILAGVATVALFMMHGSIYLVLRTEGDLRERARHLANRCMIFFVFMYVLVTMATLLYVPRMGTHMKDRPWLLAAPLLTLLAIANVPRQMTNKHQYGYAFISSCAAIIGLIALVAIGMFPDLVPSSSTAHSSLTLYNASSTSGTLKIMLIVALVGMPLVSSYTVAVYWLFRGKVRLNKSSY
jgi:cytochrome bd ubiquinol oxidase subunit II